MPDAFQNIADAPSAPATRVLAVVPHDTNPLTDIPKALYIGTGGALVLQGISGGDASFTNVGDGCILPIRARLVKATGTTATGIVALY
ncbi:MAG: hypothetical protein V4537_06980 [Pseudomonadota bacterium]